MMTEFCCRLVAVLAFTIEAVLVTIRFRKERAEAEETDDEDDTIGVTPLPFRYRISWILCNINSSISGIFDPFINSRIDSP